LSLIYYHVRVGNTSECHTDTLTEAHHFAEQEGNYGDKVTIWEAVDSLDGLEDLELIYLYHLDRVTEARRGA